MIIDIGKTIIRKNLVNLIVTIFFILVVIVLLFIPLYGNLIKGISNQLLAIYFAIAYILHAFYHTFRNYNYIYFSDEGDRIILRYFSPSIFTTRKNSIEMPMDEFAGYKLETFFAGYREKIRLFRKTKKGTASYPAVSITALSKTERQSLLMALEKLKNKTNKS